MIAIFKNSNLKLKLERSIFGGGPRVLYDIFAYVWGRPKLLAKSENLYYYVQYLKVGILS